MTAVATRKTVGKNGIRCIKAQPPLSLTCHGYVGQHVDRKSTANPHLQVVQQIHIKN